MYSIGTSAVRALRQKLKELDPITYADIITALGTEDANGNLSILRVVAFVGTMAERGDPATEGSTLLAPYSAFFVLDETNITAQLYIPYNPAIPSDWWTIEPTEWLAVGPIFDKSFINNTLIVAGGFANAQYAFQRGNKDDMGNAFRVDGIPYFAKDISELYVYNKDRNEWVPINTLDRIGSFMTFSWAMITGGTSIPDGYLKCDGSWLPIQGEYYALYKVIGTTFNYGPKPENQFRLPRQGNLLIRAKQR
jgi:hypothetical protein